MENKPALTSEQRLAYIGDMADIETREFTMDKAIKQLENSIYHIRANSANAVFLAAKKVEDSQKYVDAKKQNLLTDPPEKPTEPEKPECWEKYYNAPAVKSPKDFFSLTTFSISCLFCGDISFFLLCILILISVPLLICLISLFVTGTFGFAVMDKILFDPLSSLIISIVGDDPLVATFISGLKLVLLLVSTVGLAPIIDGIRYMRAKRKWKKYQPYLDYLSSIKNYEVACQAFEQYSLAIQLLQQSQHELQNAEKAAELADIEIKFINTEIALLQESIQSLHSQKEDLYSLGIIPPDYRTMDCVIMLHQIFRNGLKDNMADAILLYEERVYRQEIIRGIEKIYDMLGQLNDSMRAIESRLIEVKQELQMIGSDMSNQLAAIADNQSRLLSEMEDSNEAQATYAAAQEQWQREQLAETRASRYAAEAVQRSNEKYEWYMEQHRQGLM